MFLKILPKTAICSLKSLKSPNSRLIFQSGNPACRPITCAAKKVYLFFKSINNNKSQLTSLGFILEASAFYSAALPTLVAGLQR